MIRDPNTKALLNQDTAALNKYKIDRRNIKKIDSISNELEELKKTLERVIETVERIEGK